MKNSKTYIIGSAFIVAIFASIAGGLMIEAGSNIVLGVLLELVNTLCVFLIGYLVYTFYKNKVGFSYLIARLIEGLFCMGAALLALFYLVDALPLNIGLDQVENIRNGFLTLAVPISFSITGFILYYIIFKTNMLPKYIAYWGIVGATLILIMNVFSIPENFLMVFALPIILNEFYMGSYILIRGLKI